MASSNSGRAVAARALHIQISPPPRNFHESRKVFQKLQDFGEIDSFRLITSNAPESEYRVVVAVFRHEHTASALALRSPLKLDVNLQRRPNRGIFGMSVLHDNKHRSPSDISAATSTLSGSNASDQAAAQESQTRLFTLNFQSSSFDHHGRIQRQEYYWGFKPRIASISKDQLNRIAPASGLATFGRSQSTMLQRTVRKRITDVKSRQPLKSLWNEEAHTTWPDSVD